MRKSNTFIAHWGIAPVAGNVFAAQLTRVSMDVSETVTQPQEQPKTAFQAANGLAPDSTVSLVYAQSMVFLQTVIRITIQGKGNLPSSPIPNIATRIGEYLTSGERTALLLTALTSATYDATAGDADAMKITFPAGQEIRIVSAQADKMLRDWRGWELVLECIVANANSTDYDKTMLGPDTVDATVGIAPWKTHLIGSGDLTSTVYAITSRNITLSDSGHLEMSEDATQFDDLLVG